MNEMRETLRQVSVVWSLLLLIACPARVYSMPVAGIPDGPAEGWTLQEANYTGEVSGEVARLTAELKIKTLRDGLQEIPLEFRNATITDVKLSGAGATLIVRNDQYALAVEKQGMVRVTVKFSVLLSRNQEREGIFIEIPQAVFSRLTLTVPHADVELAPEHAVAVTKEVQKGAVILRAALGISRQISLNWITRPATHEVVEPVYTADVRVLATLQEEFLRTVGLLTLHMIQGEMKEVAFDLPAGVTLLSVRGGPVQEWRSAPQGESQRVTVTFAQPIKVGATQLVIEAEEAIAEQDAPVRLSSIVPVGAKRLTGLLALANSSSLELRDPKVEGLRRMDVREVPAELAGLATSPIVEAFRYEQTPYLSAFTLHRPQELAVLVAIAESGNLATVVTPTGESITRAVYQIRNNKKGSLGLTLPEGATLWSVLVDGRAVKPAAGPKGQILVPLAVAHGPESTFPVEIVYVEKQSALEWTGRKKFLGPVLDLPVTVTSWNLFLPEEIRGLWFGGNLQQHLRVNGFLPDLPQMIKPENYVTNVSLRQAAKVSGRAMRKAADEVDGAIMAESSANGRDEKQDFEQAMAKVQQTGVLPFRISLPQSGRLYRFGRLLTTQEALLLDVRYAKVPAPAFPFAAGGIGLAGLVGLKRYLRRRKPV